MIAKTRDFPGPTTVLRTPGIGRCRDAVFSALPGLANTTVWLRAANVAASSSATPPRSAVRTHKPGGSATCAGPWATMTPLSSISMREGIVDPQDLYAPRIPRQRVLDARPADRPSRGPGGTRRRTATSRPVARTSGPSNPGREGSRAPPGDPMARATRGSAPESPPDSASRAARWKRSARRSRGGRKPWATGSRSISSGRYSTPSSPKRASASAKKPAEISVYV